MTEISHRTSLRFLLSLCLISVQFLSVLIDMEILDTISEFYALGKGCADIPLPAGVKLPDCGFNELATVELQLSVGLTSCDCCCLVCQWQQMVLAFSTSIISFLMIQFSGFSDDSKSTKETKTGAPSNSMSGSTVLIICIAVAAVVGLSIFLFKLWQKKKREEQYARLLKLFEEDDELEVELGLRD